jgi:catechol 2,3-dioxygenase-like lactoylglutathione lyase family enzyme
MFSSGNATINVSDLDAAIRFYTVQLGMTLTNRFGDRWATVEAGPSYWTTKEVHAGLVLGLRPSPALGANPGVPDPPPGTTGGVGFGVESYVPIEDIAATFTTRGVRLTGEIIRFEAGNTFAFEDMDGLRSYVHQFPPEMLEEGDRGSVSNALLSGGHAIVYVSNMDAAIRFYTETLGLPLTNRFDNHFATVEVGRSLVLGIHPQTPRTPIPGTRGSVTLGLVVDEPIDTVIARLAQRGARVLAQPSGDGGSGPAENGRAVDIEDLDGNVITLWESHALAPQRNQIRSTVMA